MRVSWKWLNEYMDLSDLTVDQVANDLTLAGLEVEKVWEVGRDLDHLVVGLVESCQRIEGSDHLKKTRVNIGTETLSIVCGAPNIAKGQKVIVAEVGAILPGDVKIKKTKMMGQVSEGMICALDELGIAENVIPKYEEDGIHVLPEDAEIGADARPYIGLDDAVIEIEITPNRADALSMRGVAYDIAAIYDKPLSFNHPEVDESKTDQIADFISVGVQSTEDVPAYKMRVVRHAKIQPSPNWLQNKLMNAGIRPIDNIVDITNYVMLEYGQPLHAFDYDKIGSDEIYVRRAEVEETLTTLDGKERSLSEENLVITNGSKPLALAGIMGGQNSEISKGTQHIAIESAVFHPTLTRKTANAMNLRSESSNRFEKGVNRQTVQEAVDFAAQLMQELAGAEIIGGTAEIQGSSPDLVQIELTFEKIDRVIGEPLSEETILDILRRLKFPVEVIADRLVVTIPPRRWDIHLPEDVIEEIARIYGYNRIQATLPTTASIPGQLTTEQRLLRRIRSLMEGMGLSESVNYSLTTAERASRFALEKASTVQLANPMSEERQVLRQSLLTGLLDAVAYNHAHHNAMISLYEVGHIYEKVSEEDYKETQHIAGILSASQMDQHWLEDSRPIDFYTVKGIVETLFSEFSWTDQVVFKPESELPDWHPGRTAQIFIGDQPVGIVGQIHPEISVANDLKEVYAFEISLAHMLERELKPIIYTPVQKYPSIRRDMALLVHQDISHHQLTENIEQAGSKHLQSVELFDLFEGEQLPKGMKSVAYSLTFASSNRTLEEDMVNKEFEQIKNYLIEQLGVQIR